MSDRIVYRCFANDGTTPLGWAILCPACGHGHMFHVDQPNPHNGARWTFDGNEQAPTFSPSMLVRSVGAGPALAPTVCHSFVRNGRIEFLGDCTHNLRGQTVPLKAFD